MSFLELCRFKPSWHLIPEDREKSSERTQLDEVYFCSSSLFSPQMSKLEIWKFWPISGKMIVEFQLLSTITYDIKLGIQGLRLFLLYSVSGRLFLSIYDLSQHEFLSTRGLRIAADQCDNLSSMPSLILNPNLDDVFLMVILSKSETHFSAVAYHIRLQEDKLFMQNSYPLDVPIMAQSLSTVFSDSTHFYFHHLSTPQVYVFNSNTKVWSQDVWSTSPGRQLYEQSFSTKSVFRNAGLSLNDDVVWRGQSAYFMCHQRGQDKSLSFCQYNINPQSLQMLAGRSCWDSLNVKLARFLPPDLRTIFKEQYKAERAGRRSFYMTDIGPQ